MIQLFPLVKLNGSGGPQEWYSSHVEKGMADCILRRLGDCGFVNDGLLIKIIQVRIDINNYVQIGVF